MEVSNVVSEKRGRRRVSYAAVGRRFFVFGFYVWRCRSWGKKSEKRGSGLRRNFFGKTTPSIFVLFTDQNPLTNVHLLLSTFFLLNFEKEISTNTNAQQTGLVDWFRSLKCHIYNIY